MAVHRRNVLLALTLALAPLASVARAADAPASSGNVVITLENGTARGALTLDGNFNEKGFEKTIWGFAPRYNGMDHRGEVVGSSADASKMQLTVKLGLAPMPTGPGPSTQPADAAEYTIDLVRKDNVLTGTFKGTAAGNAVEGKAHGTVRAVWPAPVAGFSALKPGEHPRLIFRAEQLKPAIERAGGAGGEAMQIITKRTRGTVNVGQREGSTQYEGHKATGHGFLYQLTGDKAHAESARQVVAQRILSFPLESRLSTYERAGRLMGLALAYDMNYTAWEPDFRKKVAAWLRKQSEEVLALSAFPPIDSRRDRWHVALRASAGVAAMAVLGDPEADERAADRLALARRSVKLYFDEGLGDRGWDAAGDTTQLLALCHGVLPFAQASRTALGEEVAGHPHFEWVLPLIVHRLVPGTGLPAYGPGAAPEDITGFWAMGFSSIPEKYKPAAMWTLNRIDGRTTYDIMLPHHGAYALMNLTGNIKEQNPGEVLPHALQDTSHGYVVFRNRWQDKDDVSAAVNFELEPTGGIPNPGAFRIVGAGSRWVNGDSRYPGQDSIVYPGGYRARIGAKPIGTWLEKDGSGVVTYDTSGVYSVLPAEGGRKAKDAPEPPVLKPMKSLRSFGVDYSGASGAPGLFVVVDKFDSTTGKNWNMRTERAGAGQVPTPPVELSGRTFTAKATEGDATLRGYVVAPEVNLAWGETERFRHKAGGIHGTSEFFVVMTVQRGAPPEVSVQGSGLGATVTVGKQTVRFDGQRIVFGK